VGLFSFIGKAIKTVGKVAGFIPGIGNTTQKVTGVVGDVLGAKQQMSTTALKVSKAVRYGVPVLRGQGTGGYTGGIMSAQDLRSSPVMPGGAVATRSGMAGKSGSPPRSYGGSGGKKKKARKTTKRRSSTKRRMTKRRTTKRKLKFGSAAYRKKYLGHR